MFDTRKQSIPQCFIDKINIDKVVDAFKKEKVVEFTSATKALATQKTHRQRCRIAISKTTPDIIGDGGASGGSNKAPVLVDMLKAA